MRCLIQVALLLALLSGQHLSAEPPPGDPNALVPVTDNFVHCQGNYSYQAPAGWTVKLRNIGSSSACDLAAPNDCAAMISVGIIPRNAPLKKFAQDRVDLDQKTFVNSTVKTGELQPFKTASGWEGFKCIETVTTNGSSSQNTYYFFPGHGDNKIMVITVCHGDAIDHYTPIFDAAIKTLAQD